MKILELETLMNEQILRPWQYGSIVFDQFALKTKERFDQMSHTKWSMNNLLADFIWDLEFTSY